MKTMLNLIGLAFVLGGVWVFFFSGAHPQFHQFDDVTQIIVKVYDRDNSDAWPDERYKTTEIKYGREQTSFQRVLTEAQDIEAFRKALGVTWDGFVPVNSYESPGPRYSVDIIGANGRTQHLYFSNYEWGSSGSTPKRLIEHMKRMMS